MHNLKDISDYSAVKRLAAALYKFGANQHGAAIMVGAGFSRSAALHVSGNKKMPLWDSFSKNLVEELNPYNQNLIFSDPLRIAEEYRAYFGQSALNDQIRAQIDNDAWRTGELYGKLLELPWSEIMTTNWDTLLERAAKDIHGPYYTPVSKPSDLAWAPSPRIVKLHGTIGVTDTFVAAQEDYRNYPKRFASFVNFARQVFIENELCLLGFSGEDPNFLQWAGWVRDHLSDHARKIYLVGALNLSAPQRVYLESIKIAPVDLWDAVKDIQDRDLRHKTAISVFLQALKDEGESYVRKHKWNLSSSEIHQSDNNDFHRKYRDHEYAAGLLKKQLEALIKDRKSYPGWLVCPPSLRWQVQSQINDPTPSKENIKALASGDREKLLYEIAWRYGITFDYIDDWLVKELFQVVNENEQCALSKREQMEISLILLKNSRWFDSPAVAGGQAIDEYVQQLSKFLEENSQYLPDCAAELAYHKALIARDTLDYKSMENVVEKIQGEDPVWKLRQAAILLDLGRFDEAARLLATAYGELRENHRRDLYSIPTLSRLLWAHLLINAVNSAKYDGRSEDLPLFVEGNYRKWNCDSWAWIEHVKGRAEKKLDNYNKGQKYIEPLFHQGHYRDNRSTRSFSNETSEYILLEGITREVGIPLHIGSAAMTVNLLTDIAEKLALSAGVDADIRDYILAIRAASNEKSSSIKEVFTRVGVACASKEVVDILVDRLLTAILYWRNKRSQGIMDEKNYALSALRVLIEVLSRLVVRVSPEKAKEVFRLALSIGNQADMQHFWLFDVINNLLIHSLKSIPKSEQGDLLADTLSFPLQSELSQTGHSYWPNPYIEYPNSRNTYINLENRISQLIAAVSNNDLVTRSAALQRLLPLAKNVDFFTPAEYKNLSTALWGSEPDYKKIPETGFFPHALLLLPSHDKSRVKSLIAQIFYEDNENILRESHEVKRRSHSDEVEKNFTVFEGMANAAINKQTHLFPTPEQASELFDKLVSWRPKENEENGFFNTTDGTRRLVDSISKAVSYAITPALSNDQITIERFHKLKIFSENVSDSSYITTAFIYFATINEDVSHAVERIIQKLLQDRDAKKVANSVNALKKWVEYVEHERPPQLSRLISRLISAIESGRTIALQQLIWFAGYLLKRNWLAETQKIALTEALPNLFNAANYKTIDHKGSEAINASSIREACVGLASLLVLIYPSDDGLKEILQESEIDALPEVRFARDINVND